MSSDPFYVKDSLSSQFDQEDKIRQQKRLEFMEQQRKDYLEYLKMKDNKRTGTPFKITEDNDYHPPIKNLDKQDANLCTNIAKDNQYTRAGYQLNNWKIPDKYEKNFDENYIRGKNRSGYNIINHQIYENKNLENKNRMNPSLRDELEQYEKNVQNQFQNLSLNNKRPPSQQQKPDYYQMDNNNNINERNNFATYEKQSQYPVLNERISNNEIYENLSREKQQQQQYQNSQINQINNQRPYEKEEELNIPKETNPKKNPIEIDQDIEYRNYLEYIKQKELMEKEKE